MLPAPTDGRDDPFVAVPRYLEFLERRLTGGDLKSARIAIYQVETALADLELKLRSGELVLRAATDKRWFDLARVTRDKLLNVRIAYPLNARPWRDRDKSCGNAAKRSRWTSNRTAA